jgi:hypothetical protein
MSSTNKRLNIRISSRDLRNLQARALWVFRSIVTGHSGLSWPLDRHGLGPHDDETVATYDDNARHCERSVAIHALA